MIRYLNQSKNVEDFDTVFNKFKDINTNKENIKKASGIVNAYKRLKPGSMLPKVTVINKENKEFPLKNLISKPTVIYFWTVNNRYHLIDAHKKVNELKDKYPEVNFIAINTDLISSQEQANILKQNQLNYTNEFHFKSPEKAKDLLAIRPINNVFLINRDSKLSTQKPICSLLILKNNW